MDGKKIYVYGEGWNFGEVANDARFEQATQINMAGTGIGTFNDRLRDAVRGGGPFDENPRVQGFGSGLLTDPNGDPVNGATEAAQRARLLLSMDQIKVGLAGNLADYSFVDRTGATVTGKDVDYNGSPTGYTADPQENILYVSAHDNETLFDSLASSCPQGSAMEDRVRMQQLSLSTVALGPGRVVLPRRGPTCSAPSRWTGTATTPATGSTRSTSPTSPTTGAAASRPPRTTRTSGTYQAAAGRAPGA